MLFSSPLKTLTNFGKMFEESYLSLGLIQMSKLESRKKNHPLKYQSPRACMIQTYLIS